MTTAILVTVLAAAALALWTMRRSTDVSPDDPDGPVLTRLAAAGSDLSKPHPVDFFLYFPDEARASAAFEELSKEGYTGRSVRRCPMQRVLIVVALVGAYPQAAVRGQAAHAPDPSHGAMAAASGVTRADGGKGPNEPRLIPLRPMAGDVELLYGDPEVPGQSFVMRIRELPGAKVPPHSHPVDEHITVLEGTWYFAIGPEFRLDALQELKAGGYAFAPKGSTMFGYSPDGAVVQVHGVGPFRIHWKGGLHTLDDPDASRMFRFKKGVEVTAPNGRGRITQGYASGAIVQYEIVEATGRRFMADERAVTVP